MDHDVLKHAEPQPVGRWLATITEGHDFKQLRAYQGSRQYNGRVDVDVELLMNDNRKLFVPAGTKVTVYAKYEDAKTGIRVAYIDIAEAPAVIFMGGSFVQRPARPSTRGPKTAIALHRF